MEWLLDDVEVRVLGCLIEKKVTTPEYYPLTLKGLTTACNQKSNRFPVVRYTEEMVARALDSLRDKRLTWQSSLAGARVPKYEHGFEQVYEVERPATAALCVLMLRGAQTVGEIRGRSERLYGFADLQEVEAVLQELAEREQPLVSQLPRQPGRKEARWCQLLAGEPELEEEALDPPPPEAATVRVREENARIDNLVEEVAELRAELAALREAFARFRQQFE